jgi:RNA methyltransferase, TrmH family
VITEVTSRGNHSVVAIRKLRQKKERRRSGKAVVEGIQPVRQAHESGHRFDILCFCPELLTSVSALSFVDDVAARATFPVLKVSPEVFRSVSVRENPVGLLAVIEAQLVDVAELSHVAARRLRLIGLENISGPGNLGTVVRLAEGTGTDGIILAGDSADPWDPGAMKASMGSMFNVPVAQVPTISDLLGWCRENAISVMALDGHPNATELAEPFDYPDRSLLLFGNEGQGLSQQALDGADRRIRIPMAGRIDSYNVAVAAGIAVYDRWCRQRFSPPITDRGDNTA